MIEMSACKNGLDVEVWGSNEGLVRLYSTLSKVWGGDALYGDVESHESRNNVINGFSYYIRKAISGEMLHNKKDFKIEYYGFRISWVHAIFVLNAIRYNLRSKVAGKLDLAVFLEIEHWLEESMKEYDKEGFLKLQPYIDGGIYTGNPNLYLYMRSIDYQAKKSGTGKKAFRKLPALLRQAVFGTKEYEQYEIYLQAKAEEHNCSISELEISD